MFDITKKDISETFKLSMPIILGRLGAVLMGVIDTMMIGKVGTTEIAAAGISSSIFILVGIIPIGFLIVGSPMISSANTSGDKNLVKNLLKGSMQSAVILSFFFMFLMFIMLYFFRIFNQPEDVNLIAPPFLTMLIFSTLPLMLFIAIEQFSDGLEKTSISMFFNISALFVNMGINYLLIFGHFGFPALGLVGAGIGTLIARIYMCIGIWLVVKYKKEFREFDLNFDFLKIEKQSFVRIWKAGVPSGMQFFFEVSAFSTAAIMIGWLGTVPLAAHNIAISVASVSYMLSTGFATGGSIRVASFYGVKDRLGVIRAGKTSLFFVIVLMTFTCLIFILFGETLALLFSNDAEALKLATSLLILAGIFQLSDGIQVVSLRSLLGLEDVKIPTYITFISYWAIAIPLGYYLTFYTFFGVYGIWTSLCIGLTISAIFVTIRFFKLANNILENPI